MRLGLSHSRRKLNRFVLTFLVLGILALFFIIMCRLQPVFIEYASARANNIANSVVNEAVSEAFSESDFTSLAEYKNYSDRVRTIETDAVKINKLKSEINRLIQENIRNSQSETVYIPLGSAANIYFLSGLGPKIPVRIYPAGIVNTDFSEEFDSAGINQVKHRLYLDVSIEMSFVGFGFTKNETVKTSALLFENVIVGDTPQYYGNVAAALK